MKILLIENDLRTAKLTQSDLAAHAHTVDVVHDGAEGAFLGKGFGYDAIIASHNLPKKDGLEVCREIRSFGRMTPIILVSDHFDASIAIHALKAGADDCMAKPFSLEELRLRLKAAIGKSNPSGDGMLHVGDILLDTDRFTVTRDDIAISLTRKEFTLLEYLMRNHDKVMSRAMIMEYVWTADSNPFSNTIESHMRNLRKKLNVYGKPDLITNIPGRGYILSAKHALSIRDQVTPST